MKKCPFCGADIEEHAQFCLYCMTSLTEKEQILVHKQKKPQGLLILVAIVAAAMILLLLLFGKRAMPDVESQTTGTTTTADTTETTMIPTTQATTAPTVETTEATTEPTQAATQPTTKPSSQPTQQPSGNTTPPATEPADSHIHSFHFKYTTEEFLQSAATCEEPAYYYYSCPCGQHGEDVFSTGKPNGHTSEKLEGYPADCVNVGKTDGSYCSVCQKVLKEQETILAKGHTYSFANSPTACSTCGKMSIITVYAPTFPVSCRYWQINSGYYKFYEDTDSYYAKLYFSYTNISSEALYGYPNVKDLILYEGQYLKPGETGTFYTILPATPGETFEIVFL